MSEYKRCVLCKHYGGHTSDEDCIHCDILGYIDIYGNCDKFEEE